MAKKKGSERKGGRELWDGERIQEIREARDMSREELAAASGVHKDDIGRHERNDLVSNPAVDALMRLAVALGVHPTVLFQPRGAPIPRPNEGVRFGDDELAVNRRIEEIRLQELQREAPAEDTARGDIYRAQHALATAQDAVAKASAALNRALRRTNKESGAA